MSIKSEFDLMEWGFLAAAVVFLVAVIYVRCGGELGELLAGFL